MDILDRLSKGGFSAPVILGCLLEIVSLEHTAYAAPQTTSSDLISSAAASLSSATPSSPAADSTRKPHLSPTAETASTALGNALTPQNTLNASQAAPQKTASTDNKNQKNPHAALTQKQSNQTVQNINQNPAQPQMISRVQPSPGDPAFLAPILVSHAVKETKKLSGYIEVGGQSYNVTNDQGDWSGIYTLGVFQPDDINTWTVGLEHDNRFHQTGDYGQVNNTHVINEEWYSSLGIGSSDNSDFIPKYYIGGALFKKQGPKKQIVGYLGAHAYWWRGGHTTEDINPGFVYYFETPWILEAGAYINRGNPGAIYTASGYAALTQGKDKEHYYIARVSFGKESYLPLGIGFEGASIVGYPSYDVGGTWRQWVGKNWGFNVSADYYHNPFYDRYGGTYGLFWDFG